MAFSSAPASRGAAITPHDTNAIGGPYSAIFVGTGGNITLRYAGGSSDLVFKNVASGTVLPIAGVEFIRATGTTAADMIGLNA